MSDLPSEVGPPELGELCTEGVDDCDLARKSELLGHSVVMDLPELKKQTVSIFG